MKAWIGVLVTIILLAVVGWFAKSLLPLPSSSPAPAPAPVRKKIPQMPAPPPIQATESATEQVASVQDPESATGQPALEPDMETPENQGIQTDAGEQDTATDSADANQGAMEAKASAPATPPQPIDLADEYKDSNESQPAPEPEPAPAMTAAGTQADPSTAVTPPAAALPEGDDAPAAQTAHPPKEPEPQIEAAAAPPEPAAAPAVPDKPAPFNIQVGAYLTRAYADDKLNALKRLGYDAFIFRSTDTRQRTWYAVRFGWFATRDEARRSLKEFKVKQGQDAIVSRSDAL